MFTDEFLPAYDVSDAVGVVASADPAETWDELMDVDLIEIGRSKPFVGVLSGIRITPELLSGACCTQARDATEQALES